MCPFAEDAIRNRTVFFDERLMPVDIADVQANCCVFNQAPEALLWIAEHVALCKQLGQDLVTLQEGITHLILGP